MDCTITVLTPLPQTPLLKPSSGVAKMLNVMNVCYSYLSFVAIKADALEPNTMCCLYYTVYNPQSKLNFLLDVLESYTFLCLYPLASRILKRSLKTFEIFTSFRTIHSSYVIIHYTAYVMSLLIV